MTSTIVQLLSACPYPLKNHSEPGKRDSLRNKFFLSKVEMGAQVDLLKGAFTVTFLAILTVERNMHPF